MERYNSNNWYAYINKNKIIKNNFHGKVALFLVRWFWYIKVKRKTKSAHESGTGSHQVHTQLSTGGLPIPPIRKASHPFSDLLKVKCGSQDLKPDLSDSKDKVLSITPALQKHQALGLGQLKIKL